MSSMYANSLLDHERVDRISFPSSFCCFCSSEFTTPKTARVISLKKYPWHSRLLQDDDVFKEYSVKDGDFLELPAISFKDGIHSFSHVGGGVEDNAGDLIPCYPLNSTVIPAVRRVELYPVVVPRITMFELEQDSSGVFQFSQIPDIVTTSSTTSRTLNPLMLSISGICEN